MSYIAIAKHSTGKILGTGHGTNQNLAVQDARNSVITFYGSRMVDYTITTEANTSDVSHA